MRLVETWPQQYAIEVPMSKVHLLECTIQLVWHRGTKIGTAVLCCMDDRYFVIAMSFGIRQPVTPQYVQALNLPRVVDPTTIVVTNVML